MIAHATKRAITEHLDEDPAFFEKFSKLIQQAIDDYRAGRISDLEYLTRASEIKDAVVNRKTDDMPTVLHGNDHAIACFGVLEPISVGMLRMQRRQRRWRQRLQSASGPSSSETVSLDSGITWMRNAGQ